MNVIDCEQGTPEWHAARLGIATASQFSRILTAKTRKLSSAAPKYRNELLASWALGEPLDDERTSGFMSRGSDMEADAVRFYELQRELDTARVGFVVRDADAVGCSPDRLVGSNGGLEIKCPGAAQHVSNLLSMTEQHFAQVQGCMWICERDWWDLLSFHPVLPPAIVRVQRDDEYIEQLAEAMEIFCERLAEGKRELKRLGVVPAPPPDAVCRVPDSDGRWCLSRHGLRQVDGEWRCARHLVTQSDLDEMDSAEASDLEWLCS